MNRRFFVARVAAVPALVPLLGAAKKAPVAVPKLDPLPKDVATIDGMIAAFYEVISGPAGQPRQWGRDRTLYVPGIRFVSMEEKDGKVIAKTLDHQAFVDAYDAGMVAKGFYERELHRATSRFGHIAHVQSTYEMRTTAPDGPVTGRGVNSIQLYWDGRRWFISSAIWDDERPNNPIGKEFLPPA